MYVRELKAEHFVAQNKTLTLSAAAVALLVLAGCSSDSDGDSEAAVSSSSQVAESPSESSTATQPSPVTSVEAVTESTEPRRAAGEPFEPVEIPRLDNGLPATWVGVRDSGEVVVVATDSGDVIESLGVPEPLPEGAETEQSAPTFARRAPGGESFWIGTCCEPAGGNILEAAEGEMLADGEPIFVGYNAVPSPDGTLAANPQSIGLQLVPSEGPAFFISETPNLGSSSAAWLRDRRGVAWVATNDESGDLEAVLEIVELDDDDVKVASVGYGFPDLWNPTIATASDGNVYVAGCLETSGDRVLIGAGSRDCTRSESFIFDPDGKEPVNGFAIESGAWLGGFDPVGEILIYTANDGVVRWRNIETEETGELGTGFASATW